MAAKFIVSNSSINKNNKTIKRYKFFVYKNDDNIRNITLKKSNENINKKIKFQVYRLRGLKKNKRFKNTKCVFTNNIYSDKDSEQNIPNNSNKGFKKFIRSSLFRGVSKNGNKWQVLLMNEKIKYYLGNYKSEEVAAKIYDIFAVKICRKKSKTNFFYTDEEMKAFMK